MSLRNALSWQTIENTVHERLLEGSLLHTLESAKKINKQTKLINKKLKKCRIVDSYRDYLRIKKEVNKECDNNEETEDDEAVLLHDEYKKIHDAKPKNELRKFLRLCKQPEKRRSQKTDKLEPKRSPVVRTNSKLLSKTSSKSSASTLSSKKRHASNTRRTIGSKTLQNPSKSHVRRVDDEDEKLKVEKIVNDLIASDSMHSSQESDFKKEELSDVENLPAAAEQQILDNRLKVFNDYAEEDYETDVEDDSMVASPSLRSTEVLERNSSQSVKYGSVANEEILNLGEISDGEIEEGEYPNVSNHDSGNNSLSEADVFREDKAGSVAIPEATEYDSTDDRVVTLPDDLSEIEKSFLRLHGLSKNVKFDEKSNISWLDLRHERFMADEVVSESNLDSDQSQETASNPKIDSQTGDEPVIENAAVTNKSKVKIRTIERFENGCNILREYRSPNHKKSWENKSPSDITNPTIARLSSQNSELSDADLEPEKENLDVSVDSRSMLEDETGIEGDKSSEAFDLPKVQPRHRNLSVNSNISSKSYDEDLKNSVKKQLLSEIDQRLADSPSSKKRRSADSESSRLPYKRALFNAADINELFDNDVLEEETELNDEESTRVSNSSEIQPQGSERSETVKADASQPSKSTPTKRRKSSKIAAEPSMMDALYSKEQARHQRRIITDLGWVPREPKSPEVIVERTRKKRPKKLKEFLEDEELTPDTTKPYFRSKDIDEDEEIWIMDVPKTINPEDLENQVLLLGGKSELTIGNDRYKVSSKPSSGDSNISFVFAKSRRKKEYEIVNIQSKGRIKFRHKLSDVPPTEMPASKTSAVPFPKNLKMRHPLFGACYEDKIDREF